MDVFDLYAKIGLDKSEYESGLKDAKGSMSSFASSVGNGLKTVAKIGATAIAAGAAGVAALTKMGVEGYAQYEQLVGGVDTLFKTANKTVMAYAENAYKTAGMSANEYMNTITSFSASLIQSLGGDTKKAAEVGNMAITDMSDNANKMGTSMEMIQNAYNGFAKQNYTMLDNLKLGYGGTKEEMQRLIADANKVKKANGEMGNLSIDSFADVAEAIHIIQTEMGITGTTAKEAASTIEGSLAMMKGAWQNLVVGMADENANMGDLINDFVESTATAAQNLIPRIEQTLAGIGQLITELAPVISEALPVLVETVLPSLLSAGVSVISALVSGIITAAPTLYEAIMTALYTALTSVFGMSEESAGGFVENLDGLFKGAFTAIETVFNSLSELVSKIFNAISETASNAGITWEDVFTGVQSVIDFLADSIKFAIDNINVILPIVAALAAVIGTVTTAIGLYNAVQAVKAAMDAANVTTVWALVAAHIAQAAAAAAAVAPYVLIVAAIAAVIAIIVLCIKHWDDIKAAGAAAWDWICNAWNGAGEWFNTKVIQPVKNFFTGMWDGLKTGATNAWNGIKSVFSKVTDWFKDVFSKAWQAVKNVFSTGGKVFDGIKEGIVSVFKTVVNAIIGGINKVISVPFNAINNILQRIKSIEIVGIQPFNWVTTFSVPQIPKLSTGLNFVPYDEYPAFLHRGEAVLTAAQAQAWRNGQGQPANGQMMAVLVAILEAITGGNQELIDAVLADKTFSISGREFGRLVKEYA